MPLGTWRYTVEPGDEAGRSERGGGWTVRVTLHYALRDADPAATDRPLVLTFVDRAGRWLITADDHAAPDGTTTWRGPWEHGRLLVRAGASSLVLAHPANAHRLAAFVATVDDVVPRVRAAVGGRLPRRVAVLIPDDEKEMSSLVGEKLVLDTIAAVAVADSVDTERDTALGQRIVVNPANIDRLGQLGRRVVLAHEVTHLASRGFTGPRTPIWLVEGLADWVGYRDSGLPASRVADQLHAALGTGHWPGRLPVAADFAGDSPGLALAYEEAWSACRLIADRAGPAGCCGSTGRSAPRPTRRRAGRAAARDDARRYGAVHHAVAAQRAGRVRMRRTLVVTNDFPPRAGGIQAYVHELAVRQPAGSVVVFASTSPGAARRSTRPSRSRWCGSRPRCCCRPRRSPGACRAAGPGRRLHRRRGSARPPRSGCWRRRCGGPGCERMVATTHGHEAGLGGAAGQPAAAAPDRRPGWT